MNNSHFSGRKIIAFSLILSLLISSPIGVADAAAIIAEVTPVTQTGSNQTPTYTFSSDAVGTIDYRGGPCTSGTTLTVVGNNTITFDLLFENTYSTCQISVDDGMGISNILNISSFIIDTTPPDITLNGVATYNIPRGGGYSDSGAQWTDNVDSGNNWFASTSGSVNLSQTGTYILEYTHTDVAGNTATKTRTVNVVAGGIPSITLIGTTPVNILLGAVYVDTGATASDPEDGNITPSIVTVNPVNTSIVGSYTITYNVTDSSANSAPTVIRTVIVAAGSVPSITLKGTNPTLVEQGTSYIEAGADATDLQDGDISPSVTISGSVDVNTPGTYILSYNVTDSNSNPAPTVTRNVIVADRTPPVTVLNGSSIINVNLGSIFTDLGANWTDAIDGSGTIFGSGIVNTGTLGTYTLSYRKIDSASNTGNTVNRTVNVVTGAIPVITLNGSNPINILRGTSYTELGATSMDTEDGSIPVTISGSVNTSIPGVYTISYSATDSNFNTSTAIRTVNVTTGGIPVVTLTGASTIIVPFGTSYTELGASAIDIEDGVIPVTISGTVNTGSYGTYILTYSATDSNTNVMTATRTVRVIDTISPVITLLGTGNIMINAGSPYIDDGATWTDNIDGSGFITPSGIVNTNIAGLYILSYNYTDSSGNSGSFVTRQVTVAALANISYSAGPGGGGGTSSYGMGEGSYPITMSTNSNSDPLIPSIYRLLRLSSAPVTNSASDSSSQSSSSVVDLPTYTVAEPVTPYICPVIKELYASDDNGVSSVNEGEFTEDVQAMIMYRGLEGAEDTTNYSMRYLRNQSSGIVKNNEFYEGSRSITRAEFTKMLVRALSCHYTTSLTGSEFSDVGEYAWYTEYINFATSKGWVSGYPDGTFHPHDLITRGEAAKILAKAIQLETGTAITDVSFIDVPESNGFAPYIYALKENNIIGGVNSTYYDMNSNISRNEVARIFHKTFLKKK